MASDVDRFYDLYFRLAREASNGTRPTFYIPPHSDCICQGKIDETLKCVDCGAQYKVGPEGCWMWDGKENSDG